MENLTLNQILTLLFYFTATYNKMYSFFLKSSTVTKIQPAQKKQASNNNHN